MPDPGEPQRVLMLLTSHRLDCLALCLDLLREGGSLYRFDRVVLLLNGVEGRHRRHLDRLVRSEGRVAWDVIAGPRGRGERISGLQNECVRRYPDSLYFKIDEDTFVPTDWDQELLEAYRRHRDDPALALITPVIPNNAIGFHHLVSRFPEVAAEYHARFPHPVDDRCDGAVWRFPAVADWITRRFLNLQEANTRLRADNPQPYARFAQRFSINCICYNYRHWREIGGVPTEDEIGWGEWITKNGKYVVLATRALCHHYSFFVQQDWLDRTSLLEDVRRANVPAQRSLVGYYGPRLSRIVRQLPRVAARRLGRQD